MKNFVFKTLICLCVATASHAESKWSYLCKGDGAEITVHEKGIFGEQSLKFEFQALSVELKGDDVLFRTHTFGKTEINANFNQMGYRSISVNFPKQSIHENKLGVYSFKTKAILLENNSETAQQLNLECQGHAWSKKKNI